MSTEEAATKAVEELNGSELEGRKVIVERAKPAEEKQKEKREKRRRKRRERRRERAEDVSCLVLLRKQNKQFARESFDRSSQAVSYSG